uniref:Mucin-2-like n=1 Tax=Panagrellus redivivus TaxID=6233 RepID=A0A7E4W9W9_PANRE
MKAMSVDGKRRKWLFHLPILFVLWIGTGFWSVNGVDSDSLSTTVIEADTTTTLGQSSVVGSSLASLASTTTTIALPNLAETSQSAGLPSTTTTTAIPTVETSSLASTVTTVVTSLPPETTTTTPLPLETPTSPSLMTILSSTKPQTSVTPTLLSPNVALSRFSKRFRSNVSNNLRLWQVKRLTVEVAEILTDPFPNNTIAHDISEAFLNVLFPAQRVHLYTCLKCGDTNIGTMGTALLLTKMYNIVNPIMVTVINALRTNVATHNLSGIAAVDYAILAIEAGFNEATITRMFAALEDSLDVIEARVLVNCGGGIVYFSKYMQVAI